MLPGVTNISVPSVPTNPVDRHSSPRSATSPSGQTEIVWITGSSTANTGR